MDKTVNSAFIGTSLEQRLRNLAVPGVVLCGLTTDHCVSTVIRMSANLGFDTWLVADACAAFDRVCADGTRYETWRSPNTYREAGISRGTAASTSTKTGTTSKCRTGVRSD